MTVGTPATNRADRLAVGAPLVQVGALALVSIATALTFAGVYDGAGFVGPLLLAAIVPHLAGLLARTRGWTPARGVAIGVGATTIALGWAVAGSATTYGFPTGRTAERLDGLFRHGWSVFRTGVPPVTAHPGVVLLGAIVVALMALAADAIARRPDASMAALAPSLIVFVLTGTLGGNDLRIITTVVYVTAALIALALANAARIEARRTWFTGRRLASDAAVLRHALGIGGAALLAGLIVTPLLPGAGSGPLLHYRTRSGGGAGFSDYVGVSPLVDLRARLNERTNVELFRVSAPRPLAWRLIALDHFDGSTWSLTSSARDVAQVLPGVGRAPTVSQTFQISALTDRWLPAAYQPVAINLGNVRAIPESSTLVSPTPVSGAGYIVESIVERPPTAREIARTADPLPPGQQQYRRVPAGFVTPRVQAVIDQTGAGTPWARAVALRDYFTSGRFTYDTTVDLGDGPSAIDDFLATRRGFCQQFAAAFAGIARAEGIPSRVVVGFTPGTVDRTNGEYVVRGRDAHAWAELWFPHLGWRTFDPTPAGTEPGQADARVSAGVASTATNAAATTTTTTTTASTSTPTGSHRASRSRPIRDVGGSVRTGTVDHSGPSTRSILGLGLLAVLGVAGAVWFLRRRTQSRRVRRRRRQAPEPAHRIVGAWHDTVDVCARAGLPTSPALTPREQGHEFEAHGLPPTASPSLHELVEIYERSVYAPGGTAADSDRSARAWAAADAIRVAVTTGRRDASGRASGGPSNRRSHRPNPRARRT